MSQDKIITQKITGSLNASIISADASTRLDQALWAFNWFDLKRGWLYDLYNKLAVGHVRKIGAYPIFKGRLSKILHKDDRLQRDMLLIVKYPNAKAFLGMISQKIFQFKSILRTSSVKHFQFGFMQKLNKEDTKPTGAKYKGKLKYLVHVLEATQLRDLELLINHASRSEVYPHFIGQKSAMLGIQKNNGKLKTLDFSVNYVLIFSGFEHEALETLIDSQPYQEFMQSNKSNFVGIYDRKI